MKTLKDIYIKLTDKNATEIQKYIKINKEHIGLNISFSFDDVNSWNSFGIYSKQKVSLNQLKRLIDTIPTREEITRLKRQISAYKTNYDKVVKHSLSKEEVIEELTADNKWLKYKLEESNNKYYNALKDLEQLKQRKWWQIWK